MAIQLRERPGALNGAEDSIAVPSLAKLGIIAVAFIALAGGVVKYAMSGPQKAQVARASSLTTIGGKLRPRTEAHASMPGDSATLRAAAQARAVRHIPMAGSTLAAIEAPEKPESLAPAPLKSGFAGLQRAENGAYQGFLEVTRPTSYQR